RRAAAPAHRQPRAPYELRARQEDSGGVERVPAEIPQGNAGRVPPRAGRDEGGGSANSAARGGGSVRRKTVWARLRAFLKSIGRTGATSRPRTASAISRNS